MKTNRIVRNAVGCLWTVAAVCTASPAIAQPTSQPPANHDQRRQPLPRPIDPAVADELRRIPIRLDCERNAPIEFPGQYYAIAVTNRGPATLEAGRSIRWDIGGGASPQGGAFVLATPLPPGKTVVPVSVTTRADGDKTCKARVLP